MSTIGVWLRKGLARAFRRRRCPHVVTPIDWDPRREAAGLPPAAYTWRCLICGQHLYNEGGPTLVEKSTR